MDPKRGSCAPSIRVLERTAGSPEPARNEERGGGASFEKIECSRCHVVFHLEHPDSRASGYIFYF